jgi:hypothetical protein
MRFLPILLLIAAQPLSAQWSPITPGARVQVRLPEVQYQIPGPRGHSIRGRVSALTPDTLYLLVADSVGPLPIPRRLVQRLEYSRGSPSRFGSALQRGLVAGALTALVFVGVGEVIENDSYQSDAGEAALIGGAVGLVTGGLTGALYPRERWRRVELGAGR